MKKQNEREALIGTIDTGLREAYRLKKLLMSGISQGEGNPGLNHTHYRTLLMIDDNGPRCMKHVRQHLGLEAGSFTPVVDRLISEGLLERERDESDRRRILLKSTDMGKQTAERLRTLIQDQMTRRLSVLDDDLLLQLAGSMDVIRRANEKLQDMENERY